jgi:ketosteroid isomerase-like protein
MDLLPQRPEDWPDKFTQYLAAGDLDAVMTLYEPEARFRATEVLRRQADGGWRLIIGNPNARA